MITLEMVNSFKSYDGSSGFFRGDIIPNELNIKILGYYDHKKILHIAIESDVDSFKSININGMSVLFENINTESQGSFGAIVFTCRSNSFKEYFIKIINEILQKSHQNGSIESNIPYVIDNWLYFLTLPIKNKLTPDQILGLVGELLSLESFCKLGVSVDSTINAWQGPFGAKRDFMFKNIEIEVKSSSKQIGHIHKINSLEQLSFEKDEKILVYSWNIYRDRSEKSPSIIDIVNRIRDKYLTTPSQLSEFNSRLYEVGLDVRDFNDYLGDRFQISSYFVCRVDKDFPKITLDSFKNKLSEELEKFNMILI